MSARGGDQRGDQVSGSRAPPLRTFEKLIQMFLRISLENFSRKIKKILLLSLSSSLREKKERKKERKKKERKKETVSTLNRGNLTSYTEILFLGPNLKFEKLKV